MGDDLLNGRSPAELAAEIDKLIAADSSAVSVKAKQFRAIAKLQGYDAPAQHCTFDRFEEMKEMGLRFREELVPTTKRCWISTKPISSAELFSCPFGGIRSRIYFATTSRNVALFEFKRASLTAIDYAQKNRMGIVIRAILRADARIILKNSLRRTYINIRQKLKVWTGRMPAQLLQH